MHKATVYDVAEQAGVSTATVSFAFRQPDRVRPATRQRVLDAARELGYVPSASARGLARGRTGALGLYSFDMILEYPQGEAGGPSSEGGETTGTNKDADVVAHAYGAANGQTVDDAVNGETAVPELDVRAYPLYVDEVQRGFELECWHNGRAVMISSGGAERGESVTDVAGRVDGLAVFPGSGTDNMPLDVLSRRLPIVQFGEGGRYTPGAYVCCDNQSGMQLLIDHLIDQHGVSSMMFVGDLSSYDMRVRYDTFVTRTAERGGVAAERVCVQYSSESTGDNLRDLLSGLANDRRLPQALVCANDQTALRVIDLLKAIGVRVPEEVKVTGFDGILAGRMSSPTLTTVRQSMEAMGRLAAHLLDERGGKPWDEPTYYKLPVRMNIRHSCGC